MRFYYNLMNPYHGGVKYPLSLNWFLVSVTTARVSWDEWHLSSFGSEDHREGDKQMSSS